MVTGPQIEETQWFADIRKLALMACITTVASLAVPAWDAVLQLLAIIRRNPAGTWFAVPAVILFSVAMAMLPRFYFVLYRHGGSLHFTKPLRLLSLSGAIIQGFLLLMWAKGSLVFLTSEAASPVTEATNIVSVCTEVAGILLLVAFFRRPTDVSLLEVRVERQLRIASRVAVVGWLLMLMLSLFRVGSVMFVYPQLQDIAAQAGRAAPRLLDLLMEPIRNVLGQACLLVAPYVVHRIDRRSVFLDVEPLDSPDEPLAS